jgi:hypothetical protein
MALVVWRVEVLSIPASTSLLATQYKCSIKWALRWEDDGLSDHLALGIGRNIDSVSASAGRATNECVLVGRSPASMANVTLSDLACIGVRGGTSQHTETL